jgi:alpha-ribazole phosphatase
VAEGLCYGRSDLPLAADPAACAAALRPQLPAGLPLFSSPLLRCRALAERLHPAPSFDARLMEMDFGAWELRAWDAIERAQLDAWAADPLGFAPPGGESVAAMRARVRDFLAGLAGDAVLVTHAGVMKLVCAEIRGLQPADWLGLGFAHGGLTVLSADAPPAAAASSSARSSAAHDRRRSR